MNRMEGGMVSFLILQVFHNRKRLLILKSDRNIVGILF